MDLIEDIKNENASNTVVKNEIDSTVVNNEIDSTVVNNEIDDTSEIITLNVPHVREYQRKGGFKLIKKTINRYDPYADNRPHIKFNINHVKTERIDNLVHKTTKMTEAERKNERGKSGGVSANGVTYFSYTYNKYIPSGVDDCNCQALWSQGYEGQGTILAVVDTGVEHHQDFSSKIIDAAQFAGHMTPFHYHGTHVTGIAAANGTLRGVAPFASIIDARVLDSNGSGTEDSIVNGLAWIRYLISYGRDIDVVNISLGASFRLNRVDTEINLLRQLGVVVVISAGNEGDGYEGTDEWSYPSTNSAVVVAAHNPANGQIAPFSNSNLEVDITAGGIDILSTVFTNQYGYLSGTSMSAPHCSGFACLLAQKLKAEQPSMSKVDRCSTIINQINQIYRIDAGTVGRDNSFGNGILRCV